MRVLTDEKAEVKAPAPMVGLQLGNLLKVEAATLTTHSHKSGGIMSKEVGMTRGGVAHDAAAIVASMCAMKSNEEVLALFDMVYNHVLSRVTE